MAAERKSFQERMKDRIRESFKPIEGATIKELHLIEIAGEVWPVLWCTGDDGKDYMIGIQQDTEGNGPGHMDIHEVAMGTEGGMDECHPR